MLQIYTLFLGIHIFSAVIGVGPIFIFNWLLNNAKNLKELKYAHKMISKLRNFADAAFGIQLITGLLMGLINQSLFQLLWYNLSIILVLVAGFYWSIVIKAKMKTLFKIIEHDEDQEIPQEYKTLSQRMVAYNWFGSMIIIAIIVLMVFKPS